MIQDKLNWRLTIPDTEKAPPKKQNFYVKIDPTNAFDLPPILLRNLSLSFCPAQVVSDMLLTERRV